MDKSYIYQYIDWNNIKTIEWKSKDETFEYLCADFMKIKYNLSKSPSLWWKTYKWTEWPPEKWPDWLLYWFQSKFSDNSFTKDSLYNSCKEIWDWTNFLCIFTKDNYPDDKKNSKSYTNWEIPWKNKSAWDGYFEYLKKEKNINQIDNYNWNSFINELKQDKYYELCKNYFNIDKKEIYEKSYNKDDVCNLTLSDEINNTCKWFEWDDNHYKNDLERAKIIQKKYSYKKLAFSTKPWILKTFDNLEKEIADEIFDEMLFWDYTNLDSYIDMWNKLLKDTNSLKKYSTELEELVDSKRWIFVNYWTQWWSCLNYIEKNKIEFKDKRNV